MTTRLDFSTGACFLYTNQWLSRSFLFGQSDPSEDPGRLLLGAASGLAISDNSAETVQSSRFSYSRYVPTGGTLQNLRVFGTISFSDQNDSELKLVCQFYLRTGTGAFADFAPINPKVTITIPANSKPLNGGDSPAPTIFSGADLTSTALAAGVDNEVVLEVDAFTDINGNVSDVADVFT